jgi:hypothetical protein
MRIIGLIPVGYGQTNGINDSCCKTKLFNIDFSSIFYTTTNIQYISPTTREQRKNNTHKCKEESATTKRQSNDSENALKAL